MGNAMKLTTWEVNGKVIVHNEWVYVITKDDNALNINTHSGLSFIDEGVYNVVKSYVENPEINKILSYMIVKDENGNIPYWETNYREYLEKNIKIYIEKNKIGKNIKDKLSIYIINSLSSMGL
jgi:hypothetical protein